jgi:hypothetical protein
MHMTRAVVALPGQEDVVSSADLPHRELLPQKVTVHKRGSANTPSGPLHLLRRDDHLEVDPKRIFEVLLPAADLLRLARAG